MLSWWDIVSRKTRVWWIRKGFNFWITQTSPKSFLTQEVSRIVIWLKIRKWQNVFRKKSWEWTIKVQDGCKKYGSLWCIYDNNRETIDNVINDITTARNVNNNAKRFFAYQKVSLPTNDDGNSRRHFGWCTTKTVRSAFTSSCYVDFVQK